MKKINRLTFILLAALLILTLTGCVSPSLQDEGLVIGDSNYRLESGETLNHDLTIMGGNATLDENSTVNGDVTVIGGNVSVDGAVNGSVSVMGGYVYLDDNARITGELATLGGTVRRSAQAKVEGDETTGRTKAIPWMRALPINVNFDPITGPLMAFFQALALAALAIVVQLFAAPYMERTGRTALSQPVVSGGVGLLTVIVAPALLIILAITIILIPLSLVGFFALGIAALFGWLALGLMLGRQLAVWLKQSWSEPLSAGAGTLALSLLSSMLGWIPCLGWLAVALIWMVALGAVILTRFGTQGYPTSPGPRLYAPVVVETPAQGGAQAYTAPEPPPADQL
jgi:hypothetical protein